MDFSRFGKDGGARIDGVRIDLAEDAWVRVAAWMNPRHQQALQRLGRGKLALIEAGAIAVEESERLGRRAMAEAVLLDWGGFTEDEKPLPYSVETAERILAERPGFRTLVIKLSQEEETFRREEEDEAGKD